MRSINTEVPTLGDSLSWDTNLCVCDITTRYKLWFRGLFVVYVSKEKQNKQNILFFLQKQNKQHILNILGQKFKLNT